MSDQSQVRSAIEQANRRFVEAFNRGDVAGACAVYTDDARVLPPDAPMVNGRAAIQEFWQGAVAALGLKAVSLATKELHIHGDAAHEIGEAGLQLPTATVTAKYVVCWRRGADGQWRWDIDIWNMNPA